MHDTALRKSTPGESTAEPVPIPVSPEQVMTHRWPAIYGEVVRYAAYLLGGDIHAAEDVAQETAIRLWRRPEVLITDRPLTAWLRTVARNIVIDLVRRRRARPTEVALSPDTDRGSPSELDRIDAADSVAATLSILSPRHRIVVVEVYVRDRPVADVAADLGIPVGTVKSRCHHALRRLRAGLAAPRPESNGTTPDSAAPGPSHRSDSADRLSGVADHGGQPRTAPLVPPPAEPPVADPHRMGRRIGTQRAPRRVRCRPPGPRPGMPQPGSPPVTGTSAGHHGDRSRGPPGTR